MGRRGNKIKRLTGNMLREVELTSYCSSIMLSTDGFRKFGRDLFPKSLHLGGDDWWPGSFSGDASVQVIIKIKDLNYPLKFSYWKDTEIWHASRGYDECIELCVKSGEDSIAFSMREHPDFVFGERPKEEVIEEYLNGLQARFGFPAPEAPGVLDCTIRTSIFPALNFNLVPGSLGWDEVQRHDPRIGGRVSLGSFLSAFHSIARDHAEISRQRPECDR